MRLHEVMMVFEVNGLRILRSVLLAIVLVSCSGAQNDETGFLMIDKFFEESESLDGQTVELQGYLDPRLGSLALYTDKKTARLAKGPLVVVRDTSKNKTLRHEGLYYEPTCTGVICSASRYRWVA